MDKGNYIDHTYDDIIHLEHPMSKRHPRMSMHDRAAQFSPFAALTGYGDAVDETVREVNATDDYETEPAEELP